MSDGAIYSLHHLLLIMGHWALGIGYYIVLPHLPISPFLHRAIALKYAATGI